MTVKEVIKNLKKLKSFHNGSYGTAIDMAIKALEQQESKTMQEKQAESEKYEKAFDDGYENGYAQARFDYEQQSCESMRDATEEERKSTKDYIDSISKPTGLQFDNIYEELDFVQPHKKISVNLHPCEDCISREDVLDLAKKGVLISNGSYESVCKAINELPPVMPKIQEWLSSFNTESATECFTAVQELREKIKTN